MITGALVALVYMLVASIGAASASAFLWGMKSWC